MPDIFVGIHVVMVLKRVICPWASSHALSGVCYSLLSSKFPPPYIVNVRVMSCKVMTFQTPWFPFHMENDFPLHFYIRL